MHACQIGNTYPVLYPKNRIDCILLGRPRLSRSSRVGASKMGCRPRAASREASLRSLRESRRSFLFLRWPAGASRKRRDADGAPIA
jgi:hypothetical protein